MEKSSLDALIVKFAAEAKHTYDNRTAGDYTWEGLLAKFLYEAIDNGCIFLTRELTGNGH